MQQLILNKVMNLKKRILVAGASGGIGSAVCELAREAGHEVVELNRGSFAAPLSGPFDAVVFATGLCSVEPLTRLTDEAFREMFDVNCGLFVSLVRRLVQERLFSPQGLRIVAISSVSAVEGWAGGAAYCASKGALSAVCRALDVELRPRGISVVALEPRYVKTKMFDACAGRMGVNPVEALSPRDFAKDVLNECCR